MPSNSHRDREESGIRANNHRQLRFSNHDDDVSEDEEHNQTPPPEPVRRRQSSNTGTRPPSERQTANDPGQRKRMLSDAIGAYVNSSKRAKVILDVDSGFHAIFHAARSIPRHIGPFTSIHSTILNGIQHQISLDSHSHSDHRPRSAEEPEANHEAFRKILEVVPGLDNQIKWTLEHRSGRVKELGILLDLAGNKGRSDDCGSLRDKSMRYVPQIKDFDALPSNVGKESRGFSHPTTARLLCPRQLRDDFDQDKEAFCRDIMNGTQIISHDDWPSFLYPEENYNPSAIDEGLLCGPFLLACFRHIFTGPRTALKETPGKAPGKKPIAELYNITEVTAETIAYIAVLCRFVLNAKESWSVQDGAFHADIFYNNIIDLFDDEQWAESTLTWWNERVFGNDNMKSKSISPQNQSSGVSILAAQRAARRSLASNSNDTPGSSSEDTHTFSHPTGNFLDS